MLKFTTFAAQDSSGMPLVHVYSPSHMEKTASYRPDLQEFVNTFEKRANSTYVLVNAMTSGDYYGPNLNGDYFPDEQLVKYHKTFEKHAHAYWHHQNKDPQKSAGKVIFATHNPEMHRVELVIELDNEKAKDIIQRLNAGELPAVSMGTRTPSDKCSICGNRAKNTASYCSHLKYEMRKIMPDGKRAYAINDDRLTFFDISFVRVPADRTASIITKIAHVQDEVMTEQPSTIPSALIGEEWLKRAGLKESAFTKEVPGAVEGFAEDPKGLILSSQKKIPTELLDKLASEFPLKDILSTFLALRIMPRPIEFQHLVLASNGHVPLAHNLTHEHKCLMDMEEDPAIPCDISYAGFNDMVAEHMRPHLEGLSMTKPLVIRRVMLKRAEALTGPEHSENPFPISPIKNPIIPLAGMGGLYYGYTQVMNFFRAEHNEAGLDKIVRNQPWLIPVLVGAMTLGSVGLQHSTIKKEASIKGIGAWGSMAAAVPLSYLAAGHAENKIQKGEQISSTQDLVRKHPFLTSIAGAGATTLMVRGAKTFPILKKAEVSDSLDRVVYGLSPEKLDQLYNDVISA